MSHTVGVLFRRRRADSLVEIDETTPHRFAIVIPEAGEVARALVALDTLSDELTAKSVGDQLIITSTFSPRTAAVMRPLNALGRAGVKPLGFEFLDVVELTDNRALADVITAWERSSRGPARRRAEAIGGSATLEALERLVAKPGRSSGAAQFVFGCAAFNTPGSERITLALAARSEADFGGPIESALDRSRLASLTGSAPSFAIDDLLAVVRAGGYNAGRALGLVALLPVPLEPAVRSELVRLAEGSDELAAEAVGLLGLVEPDVALRELLDRLVIDGPMNVRTSALVAASQLWGSNLRPVWHRWLQDRSAPLCQTAEELIGAYGDIDDLGVAIPHLANLMRRRPGQVSWHVPREAPLIELLLRHRGEPRVEAAFDDLRERWGKLNPDIHDWVRREYPDLVPGCGAVQTDDGLVADDLMWPRPAIDLGHGVVTLRFDGTDMFETKDRFEELCAADPAIEILDADREVLYLDIDDPDPAAVVIRLWAEAGGSPAR